MLLGSAFGNCVGFVFFSDTFFCTRDLVLLPMEDADAGVEPVGAGEFLFLTLIPTSGVVTTLPLILVAFLSVVACAEALSELDRCAISNSNRGRSV